MRRWLRLNTMLIACWIRANQADLVRDVAGVAGGVLLAIGAGQVYRPLALIVPGALLLWLAYSSARRAS